MRAYLEKYVGLYSMIVFFLFFSLIYFNISRNLMEGIVVPFGQVYNFTFPWVLSSEPFKASLGSFNITYNGSYVEVYSKIPLEFSPNCLVNTSYNQGVYVYTIRSLLCRPIYVNRNNYIRVIYLYP